MRYDVIELCSGSVSGSNGWYVMVLSQYKAALFGSWRYWVVIEQYWYIMMTLGLYRAFMVGLASWVPPMPHGLTDFER